MVETANKNSKKVSKHHFIRTPLASFFGFLAVTLILVSILTFWLNRTLTDTNTYVETVAPLAKKPEVIDFTSDKITKAIMENAPVNELAGELLKPEEVAGKNELQIRNLLSTKISNSAKKALSDPKFSELWLSTNQTIHSSFVKQLDSSGENLTIDFGPTINSTKSLLNNTDLKSVSDKLEIKDGQAVVNLDGGSFETARDSYKKFKALSLGIVIVAIIFAGLAVLISTHHLKTFRIITLSAGVVSLIFALLLKAPSLVSAENINEIDKNFVITLADILTQNLQKMCLIIGIVLISIAITSKLVSHFVARKKPSPKK